MLLAQDDGGGVICTLYSWSMVPASTDVELLDRGAICEHWDEVAVTMRERLIVTRAIFAEKLDHDSRISDRYSVVICLTRYRTLDGAGPRYDVSNWCLVKQMIGLE